MSLSNYVTAENLMIRSLSEDIDTLALFVLHQRFRTFIDNSTGKNRKILDISSTGLGKLERSALIGLHAYSGNDYVSSSSSKVSKKCGTKLSKMMNTWNYLNRLVILNTYLLKIMKN